MANAKTLSAALPGFFKIDDLKGKDPVTLTIAKADVKEIGQDKEQKPYLSFLETRKELVLNGTRISQLAGIFGDNDPQGNKVKLSVRDEDVRGRKFEMICIDPV